MKTLNKKKIFVLIFVATLVVISFPDNDFALSKKAGKINSTYQEQITEEKSENQNEALFVGCGGCF